MYIDEAAIIARMGQAAGGHFHAERDEAQAREAFRQSIGATVHTAGMSVYRGVVLFDDVQ